MIVDDNIAQMEYSLIEEGLHELRTMLCLNDNEFRTLLLINEKTKGNSGTGAWNTGIQWAYKNYPEGYVSILDDDDEYLLNHLQDCNGKLNVNNSIVAVFQQIQWKNTDGSIINTSINRNDLSPEGFFIGNPGVQGSNMFFKTKILIDIDGFDEKLPNTTDRDIMIRFFWYLDKNPSLNFEVIEDAGVIHHNHGDYKVNNDIGLKHIGLNIFYAKFARYFSIAAQEKSLIRADMFFGYKQEKPAADEVIVIGMPLKK